MEPYNTPTTSIVIDEGHEGINTYTAGSKMITILTDKLGKEVFRKSFDDYKSYDEFIKRNGVSFSGVYFKKQDHPLKEVLRDSPLALKALEEGSLTLETYKENISFQCYPPYGGNSTFFRAQIYVHREIHSLNTKVKLYNPVQKRSTIELLDLKHYEGHINVSNIALISSSNRFRIEE